MEQNATVPTNEITNYVESYLSSFKCRSPVITKNKMKDLTVVSVKEDVTFEGVIKVWQLYFLQIFKFFKVMAEHKILSVPVVDPQSLKPMYVISLLHLVDFFLSDFSQKV
jgi:hypothetical protein